MPIDKAAAYAELANELAALIAGETDLIANTANMAALVYDRLPELNWAGFYFARPLPDPPPRTGEGTLINPPPLAGEGRVGVRQQELVLGPFQGKPACVRIAWGQGVCGTAAARGAAIVVPDVDEFPGHIACDAVSRAELVVPLIAGERVAGVFDLDSPRRARFDQEDRSGCERLVAILMAQHRDWRHSRAGPGPAKRRV